MELQLHLSHTEYTHTNTWKCFNTQGVTLEFTVAHSWIDPTIDYGLHVLKLMWIKFHVN